MAKMILACYSEYSMDMAEQKWLNTRKIISRRCSKNLRSSRRKITKMRWSKQCWNWTRPSNRRRMRWMLARPPASSSSQAIIFFAQMQAIVVPCFIKVTRLMGSARTTNHKITVRSWEYRKRAISFKMKELMLSWRWVERLVITSTRTSRICHQSNRPSVHSLMSQWGKGMTKINS